MNPEIKAQWLEDLRSGNFRKGRGVLHRTTTDGRGNKIHEFCCLGVLCEQAVAAGVIDRTLSGEDGAGVYAYGNDHDSTYLPQEVRDWAGIDTHSPSVQLNGRRDHVAIMNDDGGDLDFTKIADALEGDETFGTTPTFDDF